MSKVKTRLGLVAMGIAGIAGLGLTTAADAANIYNGHEYLVVTATIPGLDWGQARTAAQGLGPGWDLATVGTASENSYVESLFPASPADRAHYFIGAAETPATEGSWAWIDGTVWSFTDWWGGEPNDSGSEDYLAYDYRSGSGWAWNDVPFDIESVHGGTYAYGFVAERVVVPLPAAALLFGSALVGLTMVARRRSSKGAGDIAA